MNIDNLTKNLGSLIRTGDLSYLSHININDISINEVISNLRQSDRFKEVYRLISKKSILFLPVEVKYKKYFDLLFTIEILNQSNTFITYLLTIFRKMVNRPIEKRSVDMIKYLATQTISIKKALTENKRSEFVYILVFLNKLIRGEK